MSAPKMARTVSIMVSTVLLLCISILFAADFWEQKDYKQWSDKECVIMLTKSPWVQDQKIYSTAKLGSSDSAEGQQCIQYQIQISSALPVRQAIVRQQMLAAKYDSLPAEQKEAFDKKAGEYLAADLSDKVIVLVTYSTNAQQLDLELARYWQTQNMATLQNSINLYSSKSKVAIAGYAVAPGAQRQFQLVFPRQRDGKPLLTADDKNLTLEFNPPTIGGIGESRPLMVEFKAKKLTYKGELAY
jgi:hypothetical protein